MGSILPLNGPSDKAGTLHIGGVLLWCAVAIFGVLLLAMGLHTLGSYAKSSGLYLVAAIGSSLAGAALYRE